MGNTTEHFSPKTTPDPLPGSVHAEYVRCGKAGCHCATGARHGPYWRRYWRQDGRTRSQYIRRADLPRVAAQCQRYQELHRSQRAFRRMIRDFARRSDAVLAGIAALRAMGRMET